MAIQNLQELQFEMQLLDHKNQRDGSLEQYKATEAIHLVSFQATLDAGTQATRGMLLLNGASAVALLAFMGTAKATEWQIGMLAQALGTFGGGAFLAVGAMALAYLGQSFFTLQTRQRKVHSYTGYSFQGIAILVWLASAGLFFLGLLRSARVFSADFSLGAVFGL